MKTKREGRKEGGRDSEIEDKETRREGRKEGRMDRGGWVCVSGGGGGGVGGQARERECTIPRPLGCSIPESFPSPATHPWMDLHHHRHI